MSKPKQIAWESWNARVDEIMMAENLFQPQKEEEEASFMDAELPPEILPAELFMQQPKVLYTPMGVYPDESPLKPSDRWDCWLGYTNFDLTHKIADVIEGVEGVEALRVLGRYSFFIGVGKLFDIKEIRASLEKKLCVYTEKEILADEKTKTTVNLVKQQLQTKKYWSMLVSPEGDVEYVVSDKMDSRYLEGLNGLVELKQTVGGIILRGNNG